jgi:hypothetical protein
MLGRPVKRLQEFELISIRKVALRDAIEVIRLLSAWRATMAAR